MIGRGCSRHGIGYNPPLMGQLALGFRSLLIKGAIFFVMAALLAWALGGTLWPRAEVLQFEPVAFAGRQWHWRLTVGGREKGQMRWTFMVTDAEGQARPADERIWIEVAGPIVAGDALYYAGRSSSDADSGWRIERIGPGGGQISVRMPDRLAVEQQLARVAAGLALQDAAVVDRQRPAVIDPPDSSAASEE